MDLDDGGVRLAPQDLSSLSSPLDGNTYNHNSNSSISTDGGTTSAKGYYIWSADDSEFKSVVQY